MNFKTFWKFSMQYFVNTYSPFSFRGKYFSLRATKWVWNSFEIHRIFGKVFSQKIEKNATFEEKNEKKSRFPKSFWINTSFQ